nr:hypothetical protein Iba_chr02fCG0360 [Ipomoea batatas]
MIPEVNLLLLHLSLLTTTRFAPFASLIPKIWPLVVGIRRVVIAGKSWTSAQSVAVQFKLG